MRAPMVTLVGIALVLMAVVGLLRFTQVGLMGQTATGTQSDASLRTPWGEPDLQGIWTDEFDTRLERPERYGNREFLTEEEAANLEQETVDREERLLNRPARRTEAGASVDTGEDGATGAYNDFWLDRGTTTIGTRRTSLIVDPPNGRIPPVTPEAERRAETRV